jgi:hypothetical protein
MKRFLLWLAHPRMMMWLMPPLMLLLVVGTIAQREIGLYAAERFYFASVPMYFLLALLSLSLLAKLILKSPFTRENSGIVLTHMGALLLMLGGLLTAISSEEGHLSAAEGETSAVVQDYHDRELTLLDDEDRVVFSVPFDALKPQQRYHADAYGLTFEIEKAFRNAIPAMRDEVAEIDRGVAAKITLNPQELEKQDEANLAGIQLLLTGAGAEQDGRYILFEPMQNRPQIELNQYRFTLAVRKVQRQLPFSVTLLEFDKFTYPGSDTAREYQSLVQIDEGAGISWQALIRMNEPLRVMGYTLYQSSFLQRDGVEVSVLAVVKNKGRVFPYVASLVIGIGILWHLRVRRRKAS